ncbi:hypothetical protein [Burkholderia pseudomallei]|nr:hypothetical protein [Burkholderia pseudomallei]MCV9992638.1 hypothetical protein [Burkholderia pseudomallei]
MTARAGAMATTVVAAEGGRKVMDEVQGGWAKVGWTGVVARDPEVIGMVD